VAGVPCLVSWDSGLGIRAPPVVEMRFGYGYYGLGRMVLGLEIRD
jgi:hypothetical protein